MMINQPDNIPANASATVLASAEAQPFSVGTALREARVRLGLSVADVSGRIKFAPRQIEALEADDFARLPEIAFVRGFVRSYARLLQLDPAAMLAALPQSGAPSAPEAENILAEVPFPSATNKSNIIWLAAALVVAVALVLFAWLRGTTSDVTSTSRAKVETLVLPEALPVSAIPDSAMPATEIPASAIPAATAPAAPVAPPVVAQPAIAHPTVISPVVVPAVQPPVKSDAANGAAQAAGPIRLTFDVDAWVEVKDKDGKILLSQLNHAGIPQNVGGSPPFSLVIGNASGVHLFYKGKPVDLAPHTKVAVARLTLE